MRNLMKQIKKETEGSEAHSNLRNYFQRFLDFRIGKPLLRFLLILAFMFINNNGTNSEGGSGTAMNYAENISQEELYIINFRDKISNDLYREVERYMNKTAPNSNMTSKILVNKCLYYDMDIVFVLAQGLLESHFGTKGKAARTNSVWNVGTYDDGTILYRYEHPDKSIDPYLKLLKDKYLINITAKGDTIYKDLHHLVEDRGYINYKGLRFASARGYENSMRKLMIEINMETSISFYQNLLDMEDSRILAYFVHDIKNPQDENLQAMNYD